MSVLSQISELNKAIENDMQQIEETEQVYKNYFTKINTVNSTKNNATNKNITKIKENLKGYKTKKSTTMKVLGVFHVVKRIKIKIRATQMRRQDISLLFYKIKIIKYKT
jgi:hypothetical protein